MCTVTFVTRKRGYALGMNRDERLARAKGLPPRLRFVNGVQVFHPTEPGGGTWIALNETGATLALINWYSIPASTNAHIVSRGEVVKACRHAATSTEVDSVLGRLSLHRMNPFRLIGIFPRARHVFEWRWDLESLIRKRHKWRTQQWASSGFDEPAAQQARNKTFKQAQKQASIGSLDWLRRLHSSHVPESGPNSICMHRDDAATVSYTENIFSASGAVMRHCSGPPCGHLPHIFR
jgi:hypothetical protein